jgi:DNA primase
LLHTLCAMFVRNRYIKYLSTMEISTIKEKLSLSQLLQYYSLKPDRNLRLHCPFHEDKTPSLQVYYKTNTVFCFSSNCQTHGKAMDVIDFIMYKESCTKHEALLKAVAIIEYYEGKVQHRQQPVQLNPTATLSMPKEIFLQNMFTYFRNAVCNSKPAKDYLQARVLDPIQLEVGYNTAQFHHGARRDEQLINNCVAVGLLSPWGFNSKKPTEQAYKAFGKECIVFAMRNKQHHVTGMYFRSITNNDNQKHYYLKESTGLYPSYPTQTTQKLIITESIIDAASILQIEAITKAYSILSAYGTNRLNEEIQTCIKELPQLQEIIFAFDNDEAGNKAVKKYATQLKVQLPSVIFTTITLPNKDLNETLQTHADETIISELLHNRKEIDFSFLTEEQKEVLEIIHIQNGTATLSTEAIHTTAAAEPQEPSEATLHINPTTKKIVTPPIAQNIKAILKHKELLKTIGDTIGNAGIVGEENSRLLLFLIVVSYVNHQPIHGIVQGSSGSGKTHMISRIADMMPQEDVLRFTRITESSLYNWGEFDLYKKVIIIEDLDGLKEDALYSLRELISNQVLRSSVTIKDKKGNNKSAKKEVRGQFSSLSATTKGETYEDNMNRSFVIAIDESQAQTEKIIQYQNKRITGALHKQTEQAAIQQLQQITRALQHYEVINPFADQLTLPNNVRNKRRLNEMVQTIIKQITLLHQYQRKQTQAQQLISDISDVEKGIDILFESIVLKIDELDGSLRQFFEKLKRHFGTNIFNRFEAMEVTGFKKTQLQHYLNELIRLEYIQQNGFANRGFSYKISHNDNIKKMREALKAHFKNIIENIKKQQEANKKKDNPNNPDKANNYDDKDQEQP